MHRLERPRVTIRSGCAYLFTACALLLFAGCGYVGDTLPPALYIPLPVADLTAQQQGADLLVQFSMPMRSVEDLPLESIPEVDLRFAIWENRNWDASAWEAEAQRLPVEYDMEAGTARIPAAPYVGRRLLMRVRVAGEKQRFSSWSEPVTLLVADPQPAPNDVRARPRAEGVQIEWRLPAAGPHSDGRVVEVWRQIEGEEEAVLIGETAEDTFVDRTSPFGIQRRYRLRTRVEGDGRLAYSTFTSDIEVLPIDSYAPEAPTGLLAIAAATSTELSWQASVAPDFSYYRVYRAEGEQDFVLLADKLLRSVYSDGSAPVGIPLRYRVTAVDSAGNESDASQTVAVEIPR